MTGKRHLFPEHYLSRSHTSQEKPLKLGVCCLLFFVLLLYKTPSGTIYVADFDHNITIYGGPSTKVIPNFTTNNTLYNVTVSSKLVQPKYFVYTKHCRMPYLDPFTSAAKKIFHPPKQKRCNSAETFVRVIFDGNLGLYLLHLNENIIEKKYPTSSKDFKCCYKEIVRSGSGNNADEKFKALPCSNFHQDFVVPFHIQYAIINCMLNSSVVYEDALSFIQRNVSKEINSKTVLNKGKPLSVLLFGIDSLSRMNFRRNMPMTFDFMQKHNWFELFGYNKMGDNTFPNLMAVLTGMNATTAYSTCQPKLAGGLNNCSFIWKSFKEAGYHTAYAEDTTSISTFNYLKKGFLEPPTDYYLRPLLLAIEKNFNKTKRAGLAYCLGRKQYGEYVYDFAEQFANRFQDKSVFGLFWTNSFSHNSFDTSSTMDWRMLEYFKNFERNGVMENSIVIFFSDHGCRWGSLLYLFDGFFEERLPMFFIHLPIWFRNAYPDYVKALEINQHRLTSPYDVFLTMQHIIRMHDPDVVLPACKDCGKSQSLFKVVPEERTCEDVGIIEHWCTCIPYEVVPTSNEIVKNITQVVIDQMNMYLGEKNLTSLCKTLKLKSIQSAYLKMDEIVTELKTYRIKYTTNPNKAEFQATIAYNRQKGEVLPFNVEEISRLNSYAKDSECISDKQAKLYCIC